MSDREVEQLGSAIKQARRTPSLSEYSAAVAGILASKSKDVRPVIRLLINLYQLRHEFGVPVDDFVGIVAVAIADADDLDLDCPAEVFNARLSALLSLGESVGIVAKAIYLRSQFGASPHSLGLATDMRPIFKDDPKDHPAAAIIVHNLTVQYHDGAQVRSLSLELTGRDLAVLRGLVERAGDKEQGIRHLAQAGDVEIIEEAR